MKNKKPTTQSDINMLYVQMVLWLLAAYAYFHFIIMGWSI